MPSDSPQRHAAKWGSSPPSEERTCRGDDGDDGDGGGSNDGSNGDGRSGDDYAVDA